MELLALKTSLYQIFKQIVQTYPYGKHQLNTFCVLDDGTIFAQQNLGKLYTDYLNGFFWQRDWVAAGAIPDQLQLEYMALTVEVKKLSFADTDLKDGCFELWVMVSDKVDCRNCTENRSVEEVDTTLQRVAMEVIQEFNDYGQYTITDSEGSRDVFATSEMIGYFMLNNIIDSYVRVKNPYIAPYFLENRKLEIAATSLGVPDKVRAVAFPLLFCGCKIPRLQFDYRPMDTKHLGIARCETCG